MRRQQHSLVLLLVIGLFSKTYGQDTIMPSSSTPVGPTSPLTMTTTTTGVPTTSWNGDPKLCPPPPSTTVVPPRPMPKFPRRAEFGIERVEYDRAGSSGVPGQKTMYEHVYDYDANSLIIVKNQNNAIDVEYFYYNDLKKSTYFNGDYCTVSDIGKNNDMDGTSAIQLADGTWHIRPLNEYLLFSNIDPARPMVQPTYIEETVVRGIPVDVWQSCYVVREQFRTVRRVWAFAKKDTSMPFGIVGDEAVPIQAIISASYSFPNGTEIAEVDEIYNVINYRPGIQESTTDLAPPKGVFCASGDGQQLASLDELGISWPDHFSVRVETSTTRLSTWERFHLRYSLGRQTGTRRLRYDYLPPGAEDFKSVIHDYNDNLTYAIDRRLGTCQITRGVEYPAVSPLRNPIEFFIKHEQHIIFSPPQKRWQFNGFRACRGNTILCTIATTSIDNFPEIVDSDTGLPTGETWVATNVEYGWSARAPNTPSSTPSRRFDYPVTLFLKMYRFQDPLNPASGIVSQNVEYEFYEMNEDRSPFDFDISSCYRANAYEYSHVYFSLKAAREEILDSDKLNIADLEYRIGRNIVDFSKVTKMSRVADLEIERETAGNTLNVFFTMLGQTRVPETNSFNTNEPTAATALNDLKAAIDEGRFKFTVNLLDGTTADFSAEVGSLKDSVAFMSTHSRGKTVVVEEYSGSAKAVAIIVGLVIGVVVGVLIIVIIRVLRKQPVPGLPRSFNNPAASVNYRAQRPAAATDA